MTEARDGGVAKWDLLVTPWHLDEHLDAFPVPDRALELPGPACTDPGGTQSMIDCCRRTADAVAGANRPLLLSGDCTAALGAVAGLQRHHDDIGLVWLDAHGDFNTPEITVSGYLAGMSLAMLVGRAPEPFCEPLGLRPVAEGRVVLLGARDLDPAERRALDASQVRRMAADPDTVRQELHGVSAGAVYLHVDVDVVDRAELPGLRFPTAGGPPFSRIENCLAEIVAAVDLVGAGIACAWSPERIGDEVTRHAIGRIAGAIGADLHWPAHDIQST